MLTKRLRVSQCCVMTENQDPIAVSQNHDHPASDGRPSAGAETQKLSCFIVCPIGDERSEIRKRSDQIKKYIIDPAVIPLGYETTRADLVDETGQITTQIVTQLLSADLIIADLTGQNPNVFYELAIRHAFGRPFIQIIDKSERIPFDVAGQWTVMFDHKDLDSADDAKKRISRAATTIRDGGEEYKADNPVTQTVDLQQLRSSGNPEQIAMAEISAALTDIRTELRTSSRANPFRATTGYTSDQLAAIRQVLLGMASDGRFRMDDLETLKAVPASKAFTAFLDALRGAMNKADPFAQATDDPWSRAPATKFGGGDDEPPF